MVEGESPNEHPVSDQVRVLFEDHYLDYVRHVSSSLHRRFPSVRDRIEDITHEALSRTWEAWSTGRQPVSRNPLPYMYTTARNLALDAIASREAPMSDDDLGVLVERRRAPCHEVLTPLDPLDDIVRPAVAGMKDTQRKAVARQQVQGGDEDTIAAALQVPRQQVRSLASKAVRELRDMAEVKPHIRPGHLRRQRRGEEDAGE
ncbi:sigma factor [Streptomyces xanthochromogenes]|uniref:RNA polymerase sigma factor n=1 Tax=Streptomyces xanthochromogenes TaxID=67384 RepID=UPI003414BDED